MNSSATIDHMRSPLVHSWIATTKLFLSLTKPRIVALCIFSTAMGVAVAPAIVWAPTLWALFGTALAVASANALNMYIERDIDREMERTQLRPLPTGQLHKTSALVFGFVIGLLALIILFALVNFPTAILGAFALLSYVLVYTPLKKMTPWALVIGAVPGALPALMGYTAATGRIELPGIILFGVLFFWQMPHFIAIAIMRRDEYARAGLRVISLVSTEKSVRNQALSYTIALVATSVSLTFYLSWPLPYAICASGVSAWFLYRVIKDLYFTSNSDGARKVFLASLVYLPALSVGIFLNLFLDWMH